MPPWCGWPASWAHPPRSSDVSRRPPGTSSPPPADRVNTGMGASRRARPARRALDVAEPRPAPRARRPGGDAAPVAAQRLGGGIPSSSSVACSGCRTVKRRRSGLSSALEEAAALDGGMLRACGRSPSDQGEHQRARMAVDVDHPERWLKWCGGAHPQGARANCSSSAGICRRRRAWARGIGHGETQPAANNTGIIQLGAPALARKPWTCSAAPKHWIRKTPNSLDLGQRRHWIAREHPQAVVALRDAVRRSPPTMMRTTCGGAALQASGRGRRGGAREGLRPAAVVALQAKLHAQRNANFVLCGLEASRRSSSQRQAAHAAVESGHCATGQREQLDESSLHLLDGSATGGGRARRRRAR